MEALQMRVYLEEIADASQFGVLMRDQFLNLVADEAQRQTTMVWMSLQAALLQYGMVSKFLFPIGGSKTAEKRGQDLRAELGVPNDSPIQNRDARNALEHFDERLDRCIEQPQAGILQAVHRDRAEYEYLRPERWIIRRAYIADEDVLVSEGKVVGSRVEMPLRPIFDALAAVYKTADDLLMTKYRLY
jgi:hypothetical protein